VTASNPWRNLSAPWQQAIERRLHGSPEYEWRKGQAPFRAWYRHSCLAGDGVPVDRSCASADEVFPEFVFNNVLTAAERASLLCVLGKLRRERLLVLVEKIGWVGESANLLFWPRGGSGFLHDYLVRHEYGDWWAAGRSSKWDWGVRSRFRGCQCHFRGRHAPSAPAEIHIDMNNPGDSPGPGELSSGLLRQLADAMTHTWRDDWFRSATHSARQVRRALLAQRIHVPVVDPVTAARVPERESDPPAHAQRLPGAEGPLGQVPQHRCGATPGASTRACTQVHRHRTHAAATMWEEKDHRNRRRAALCARLEVAVAGSAGDRKSRVHERVVADRAPGVTFDPLRMVKDFRLIVTVRRGSASNLPGVWERYPTLEEARAAGAALARNERVTRVAVVRNDVPPTFVEWLER
jgi:hypothetical protein